MPVRITRRINLMVESIIKADFYSRLRNTFKEFRFFHKSSILLFIKYHESSHPGSRNARRVRLIGENSGYNF